MKLTAGLLVFFCAALASCSPAILQSVREGGEDDEVISGSNEDGDTDQTTDNGVTDDTTTKAPPDETTDAGVTDETTDAGVTDETTDAGVTDETTVAGVTDQTTDAGVTDQTTDAGVTDQTTDAGVTDETTDAGVTDQTTDAGVTDETTDGDDTTTKAPPAPTCENLSAPDKGTSEGQCQNAKKGDKCSFKCNDNKQLIGEKEVTCNQNDDGTMKWSAKVPECGCGALLPQFLTLALAMAFLRVFRKF